MINLLPPDYKDARKYARRNARLVRYISMTSVGLLSLIIVTAVGYWYISITLKDAQQQKNTLQERIVSEKLDMSIRDYDELASRTKSILQILQKQVLFSNVIQKIAPVLPQGSSLQDIKLSDTDTALTLRFSLPSKECSCASVKPSGSGKRTL
jgi:Tfp pilus assembly protein PilN